MKKLVLIVLSCLLFCMTKPMSAQQVQMISGCGMTVSSDATAIDFGDISVTNVKALTALLDQMPQLERVDMYQSRLEKTDMDMLFYRYPQIMFGWTYYVGDHRVRTDITAFSTLHGSSPDPIHTEKDFQWLKFCKGLKAIDVGHNWVRDISWLGNFPELKVLILAVNSVEDLTPLAKLKDLEYLELFTNKFTDITPLTELKKLKDLNIKYNAVEDIRPLYNMTWLERLWLGAGRMKEVPMEQRAQLEEALFNTEVDWDSKPTAGTWRNHPRYDIVYEMFHGTKYIPFE